MKTTTYALIKKLCTVFFLGFSLNAIAEIKVDFNNLPYVEDYWMLPVKEVQERAVAGDPFAQDVISKLHLYGSNGYLLNEDLVQYWLQKSLAGFEKLSNQGNTAAQYKLGRFYTLKNSEDFDKAIMYYKLSADQGYALAQFELGKLYNQDGAMQDLELSAYWYQQALPGIKKEAQKNKNIIFSIMLYIMYRDGLGGVESDIEQTNYWKNEVMQKRRGYISSYKDHPYNALSTIFLIMDYMMLYDESPETPLLYKAYALITFHMHQSSFFQEVLENIKFEILEKGDVSEEDLEQFAQTCLKKMADACY